ncbi:hypothetical protein PACILC2_05560 [Paenibacillus cisolokensis]|uniref:DNA-directed RNA polymerase subunit beta n=1 Tax=Paenibacillus cisolokensis TaxID=1658519 RepID=A0ABQ4N1C4_9BACL|nr:DNA-directed RNA polymerase subunit beta [Paenibacillus cisolokensis]GIQ61988.1 hypothetical protein PACILC2_05560 [Paenibacillus cisolokensis]
MSVEKTKLGVSRKTDRETADRLSHDEGGRERGNDAASRTEGETPSANKAGASGRSRSRWLRALRIILRICVVPVLFLIALCGGLYIGYVVLGNGSADDVFDWTTWQHMYDLIFADS